MNKTNANELTITEETLEGAMTTTLHIDTGTIPEHVQHNLAATTLACVKAFLLQPGGRKALDAQKAARKAAAGRR